MGHDDIGNEALRRTIALIGLKMIGGKAAVAAAIEGEKTLIHGRTVGLTDDQSREVVRAWSEWYRCTPWPLDWKRVREAMTARAMDLDWQPPA